MDSQRVRIRISAWWSSLKTLVSGFLFSRSSRLRLTAASSTRQFRTVYGDAADKLGADIKNDLNTLLAYYPGVVVSTVTAALTDFNELQQILNRPGSSDIISDVSVLGDAEALFVDLLAKAKDVAILTNVAGESNDRSAREAAGDMILALQDQRQILHRVTSSALRWASSQNDDDLKHYHRCIAHMGSEPKQPTQKSFDKDRE